MKTKLILIALLIAGSAQAQQQWTLRDCIIYALEHNIEIQKQKVVKQQEEVSLSTAKNRRLPNLTGDISQSFSFGRAVSPLTNSYINTNNSNSNFSISTSVPLFTGFEIPNTLELNKLNLKAATEDLNKAKEDISVEVTSSYLQVLFNIELLSVAQEQVNLSKEQLSRVTRLNEVGKASTAEVYDAKSRLAQDELSTVQAENNKQLSILDLTQLLELPSPEGFSVTVPEVEPDFASLTMPEDIFNQALLSKPSILAAQYRLAGSEKNIKIAQSAYYPQLSLGARLSTGYYNISGTTNRSFSQQWSDNFNKYIGLTLSVPIFNRFATRNQVKSARLQWHTQSLLLESSKKVLYKEIQQAYYNAVAALAKYNSSKTAVSANEESFKLMREKFENGKANAYEFNEVKMTLMKSTSDHLQAKYDYIFRSKILDFYKGIELNL